MKLALIIYILVTALLWGSIPVHAEELPEAVAKLNDIREREIDRINVAYLKKLDGLLADYQAKGDAEAVAAVEQQIAEVRKEAPPEKREAEGDDGNLRPLVGVWRRDTDGGIWNIPDTKGGVFNGTKPFTLTYDAKKKHVVALGQDWVNHLSFTSNPDVIFGIVDLNGRKTRYRLERVK